MLSLLDTSNILVHGGIPEPITVITLALKKMHDFNNSNPFGTVPFVSKYSGGRYIHYTLSVVELRGAFTVQPA